jgi:hypothetical protein
VETRLKGYKYFEIEIFFNILGVLIDGILNLVYCYLFLFVSLAVICTQAIYIDMELLLTKMQVKFSIFFHHGSLNVIGDKFGLVRSKLKSR